MAESLIGIFISYKFSGLSMARPQQYDRSRALNNAMFLFWRQGFNATNLPQLLDCTGLSRSSFYGAFSDKRTLFIECFELYIKDLVDLLDYVSESDEPALALHHYFENMLNSVDDEQVSKGCLIVNTLLECEGIDSELHQLAQHAMDSSNQAFRQCFINAIEAGNIEQGMTPDQLTQLLSIFLAGIQVRRRASLSMAEIKSLLDVFILSIGAKSIEVARFEELSMKTESKL